MQVTISMSLQRLLIAKQISQLRLYSAISEHTHLGVPERRITNEFTNTQHPLNMVGVSKLKCN
jgi:hypothetical protein